MTVEEIEKNGLGDADYVEITGVNLTGDYVVTPPQREGWPAMVQYPILSATKKAEYAQNGAVSVAIVGWTKEYTEGCIERGDCITAKENLVVKGSVRRLRKGLLRIQNLSSKNYQIPVEKVIMIQVDKAPLNWYWHLLIMVVIALSIFLLERKSFNKKNQPIQDEKNRS